MADKTISELSAATQITASDLFVLEQSGTAKKLTGQILENWMVSYADGHGGIQSIVYTAPTPPSLDGTITITLADETVSNITLKNGKGISSVAKTGTAGLVDTYTITYNDSSTSTFTVTNGATGATGAADYLYIKYASAQPTSDADMGNTPDAWMGAAVSTSTTAPAHYTSYAWYQIKGDQGDTGNTGATGNGIASITTSGGGQGQDTTITITQTNGTVTSFGIYNGLDGQGTPSDDTPANLGTAASGSSAKYSRSDHVHQMPEASDIPTDSVGVSVQDALDVAASAAVYTASITTTWTGTASPYVQTVAITGVTTTDTPIVDLVPSATFSTAEAQVEAWGYIYRIVAGANNITVYATEQTTTDIPIQLLCVR